MRKLASSLIFVAVAALAAPPAFAQSKSAQKEPASILPDKFAGWTTQPDYARASFLSADIARETGHSSEGRMYSSGSRTFGIEVQRYTDPSAAYESYTAQLAIGMFPGDLKVASAVDRDHGRMLILVGNLVADVRKPGELSNADLQTIVSLLQSAAEKTPYPPIRGFLPEEGLVQGSQRYALGPAAFAAALNALDRTAFMDLTQEVNFKIGAEAMLGRYVLGRGPQEVLLLLAYPTPQLAEQHLHHIDAALVLHTETVRTTVERQGSLLSIVLGPSSTNSAQVLRQSINYGTQVTWNEPSHTLTDPPWVTVLKNIFLGTFFFCGLALVLGIAFGGFRVLIKRLFPGKVFDRPKDLEVLQLGLSGKPIDPKDLY